MYTALKLLLLIEEEYLLHAQYLLNGIGVEAKIRVIYYTMVRNEWDSCSTGMLVIARLLLVVAHSGCSEFTNQN